MRRGESTATTSVAVLGGAEPRPLRGVLTSGDADQLAALVARAARAAGGIIHYVEGDRLQLYGGWGLGVPWDDVSDAEVRATLAGVVLATGEPLAVDDVSTDPRVPPQVLTHVDGGAYLGHPIRDGEGRIVGICCAFDPEPRAWTADDIAAVAEAAQVSTLLITEQQARHDVDRQRRFLDAVVDSLHDGVTACDADGRIVLINARMRPWWGDAAVPRDLDDPAIVAGLEHADGGAVRPEEVGLARALRGEHLRDEEVVLG